MKYVYGLISGVAIFLTSSAFAEIGCECPKLGCDPCSIQRSVKFYTDKCGPADSKVKSCARPLCVPVENPTAECPVPPAANSGPRAPVVVKAAVQESTPEAIAPNSIGKVKVIQGSVSIVHSDGGKSLVTKDTNISEGDTIESGADGTAIVNFEGGNKLHVQPDTAVAVKEFKDPKVEASRKALLFLIKGKIRNQVEQKYNGKTSYYRIQTKSAVAGVRGTDFIVEQVEDGSKLETTIETFKGKVILSDLDEKESREITKGEGAHFSSDTRDVHHGVLGPIYKIDAERLKELDRDSRVDVAKTKKPKEGAICTKPKGMFNQCAWSCVNNPAGESKCRIDLPKVACLRQRCNGNGVWAEETRLPDPEAPIACPATGFSVKDCDY